MTEIVKKIDSFTKIIQELKERRDRIISGKYNCIPLPFKRFKSLFPGTEKRKYIIITANQKVGKSKLADYLYIYEPLFFMMEHEELRVKVLYFTLEMSAEDKKLEFMSYLLYKLDNIHISPTDLKSVNSDNPVDPHIFELLNSDKYQPYLEKFTKMVTYIDDVRNPTGINKACREYGLQHGTLNKKTIQVMNPMTNKKENKEVVDTDNPYTPNDPELYKVVILDNASNLTLESGMNKMQTIDKMSKYAITLRNQLQYIFVLIQHQAQAQEGIENIKMGRMFPTSDGLADCKTTSRDCNMMLGIYSPFKFNLDKYEGYDITKLRNYSRFLIMCEDRDYGAGGCICPLFFDGASSYFYELPLPNDKAGIEKVYNYISYLENLKKNKSSTNNTVMFSLVLKNIKSFSMRLFNANFVESNKIKK